MDGLVGCLLCLYMTHFFLADQHQNAHQQKNYVQVLNIFLMMAGSSNTKET